MAFELGVISQLMSDFLRSASAGFGNRLSADYKPGPFEAAQKLNSEIQAARLQMDMQNFRERMAADRSNQIAIFERQKIDHTAATDRQREFFDLQTWPLDNYPHEILSEINRHNGSAVNLFICATENNFFSKPKSVPDLNNPNSAKILQKRYIETLRDLNYWVTRRYPRHSSTHPVVPYIVSERNRTLNPHAMSIKLRHKLNNAPCIFVHIDVRSLDRTPIYLSAWGISGASEKITTAKDALLFEEVVELRTPQEGDLNQKGSALDFSLKALISGLIDLTFMAYLFDDPILRKPIAQDVLTHDYPEASAHSSCLFTHYDPLLQRLGAIAPADTADAMLDLVESFQQRRQEAIARHYFEKARNLLGYALAVAVEPSEWHATDRLPLAAPEPFEAPLAKLRDLRANFSDLPTEVIPEPREMSSAERLAKLSKYLRDRNHDNQT